MSGASRKLRALALAAGLAALVAGCGGGDDDGPAAGTSGSTTAAATTDGGGEPQRGGELVAAVPDPIDSWDPGLAIQISSFQILKEVMEPLVRVSDDGQEIEPGLAASWKVGGKGTKLTFDLQPGAKFSDGSPVTSDDVVFSAQQWQAGPLYAQLYAMLGKATAKDEDTVVFTMPAPSSMALSVLTWASSAIVPKDFGGKSAKAFYKRPVGAGPFMIADEKPGQSIVLERNPNYYDSERPYLDGLTYNVVADNNQRLLQLEGAQAGLVDRVPLDLVSRLPGEAQAVETPSTSMSLVVFNHGKGPGKDPAFRKAFSLAVDRDAIAESIYDGRAEVARSVLPHNIPGSEGCPSCDWSTFDAAAAKEELGGGSYDGKPVSLLVDSARGIDLLAAQAIQPMLEEAGIVVEIDQVDSATFLGRLQEGDYEVAIGNYTAISPTANDSLSFILATGFFFTGAKTDAAMAAFGGVMAASEPAAQAEAVAGFEKAAFDDTTVAPLVSPDVVEGVGAGTQGLALTPGGLYNAANLWLET